MTITIDDVTKVAKLASLKINEEEATHYLENLQNILKLANQMETVATESIEAVAHCFYLPQCLRSDEVTEINQRNRLQQLSQQIQSGLYCVPPVID